MKKYPLIFLLTLLAYSLYAQDVSSFFTKTDQFLKTYVQNGTVAYEKIHSTPSALDELFNIAATLSISKEEDHYKAFWINAYNLAVIKGIITNYPMNSPLDKGGFFDKITYEIAGQKVTLNSIENTLLRAQFKDPRLHFVLVCGAIGCPPLIPKAYFPETLDKQLKEQTELAINGDSFIKVNIKKKRVEASEILKWYKEDFVIKGQSEIDFLNLYRKEKIPPNFKLRYFTYNWTLNSQP